EFACEGPSMWPYPYGTERDHEACNIDRADPPADRAAFADPFNVAVAFEALDHRAPSGSFPRCVSPFGVFDMTGNVSEWVAGDLAGAAETPFVAAQKGGGWDVSRARCRPIDTSHDERFRSNDLGFRCCRDVKGAKPMVLDKAAKIPRKTRMKK